MALFEAALSADYVALRRVAGALAQKSIEGGNGELAKRLRALIRRKGVPLQTSGVQQPLPVDGASRLPLLEEQPWPVTPAIMNEGISGAVRQFLDDAGNIETLVAKGLSSRLGVILSGPPGTGKTLLAGHLAARLKMPFFVARLDSLISSRLGETAKNIRQIFDFVPTRGALLFLDEMDAIAKLRDDRQELGELKRVVNTVIQGLDSLDDSAVVVGATNHPQLLDPAIWRRFPYHIELTQPDETTRSALWHYFLYRDTPDKTSRSRFLGGISDGLTGAEIENISLSARRASALSNCALPEDRVLWAIVQSRTGPKVLPPRSDLSTEQRRQVVLAAADLPGIRQKDLADMLGVSRQMITRYLKEPGA